MKIIKHPSRPAHIYLDNTPYFITASINQHKKLLDDNSKTYLQKLLQDTFKQYNWQLKHWVILNNHYHLLCHSHTGRDLTKIISKIHSLSSRELKSKKNIEGKIWDNYWDYCPRNENDYHLHLCYLLNNPYKHGYVLDLHDWQWSSFHKYYRKIGRSKLQQHFKDHSAYQQLYLSEDP